MSRCPSGKSVKPRPGVMEQPAKSPTTSSAAAVLLESACLATVPLLAEAPSPDCAFERLSSLLSANAANSFTLKKEGPFGVRRFIAAFFFWREKKESGDESPHSKMGESATSAAVEQQLGTAGAGDGHRL